MSLYLCEAAGARLLATNVGHTLVTAGGTTDVVLDVETWDLVPAGPVGDCIFRSIDIVIQHDAGYAIGITPIVDGVTLTEQLFQGSSPEAGTTGVVQLQAFVASRGARVAARIRQTAATGVVTLVDASTAFTVIRTAP